MKYPQIYDGQAIRFNWKTHDYKMACCDCDLVHRLCFRVKGNFLIVQGYRDNRATAQLRRHRMPVCVEKRGSKWRVVECDSRSVAKNRAGTALDGGGHSGPTMAKRQARAVNTSLHKAGKI